MTRFTRIAAAALIGAGFLSTGALAQGPYVVGSGDNASVVYPEPSRNVVGGALTRTIGSGESATTEVIAVQHAQTGRFARVVGSGDNASVVYDDQAPASLRLAERGTRG